MIRMTAYARWGRAVCFFALLLGGHTAMGFSVNLQGNYLVRWQTNNLVYELNASGSRDILDDSDLNTVRKCALEWTHVDCSALTIRELGLTNIDETAATNNDSDGHNVITWIEDNRWQFGAYVLGVTTPMFDRVGRIFEADIAFNGFSNHWSTNGFRGTDLESVVLHEMGHFFGLQHVIEGNSSADPPTMAPAIDPQGRTRGLIRDDQLGACFLYPQAGSYPCDTDDQCPRVLDQNSEGEEFYVGRLVCREHVCSGFQQVPRGNKRLGDTCASELECANPLYCQPTNVGSFCTQGCTPNQSGSCPEHFTCVVSQQNQGACFSNTLVSGNGSGGGSGNPPPTTRCQCDRTFRCDNACACDPECSATPPAPGGSGGSTGGGSTGGQPTGTGTGTGAGSGSGSGTNPPGSSTDANTSCACDTTLACDTIGQGQVTCDCDPECAPPEEEDGGRCSAAPGQLGPAGMIWLLAGLWILRRVYIHVSIFK